MDIKTFNEVFTKVFEQANGVNVGYSAGIEWVAASMSDDDGAYITASVDMKHGTYSKVIRIMKSGTAKFYTVDSKGILKEF